MRPEAARQRPASRRVVVTGLGVVAPNGVGVDAFWEATLAGELGTRDITRFDTEPYRTRKGGEVTGFEPERWTDLDPATLARSTQFAIAATRMAVEDAEAAAALERRGVGVCFGIVVGNRPRLEHLVRARGGDGAPLDGDGPAWHDPSLISRLPARQCGLSGPNLVLPTACAAGNGAVGYAFDTIRAGRADAMVAGGADELSEAMFMMFNSFRALAPDVVAPFDRERKGLMLAEGAGALVLESLEAAQGRGARIYAEVLGHGNFADAYHMTAPHPSGLGAIRSMEAALAAGGIRPADVDYVSAHGTGTLANDQVEARAIREVFREAADTVPVSSIKSMLGHSQGAASAMEAVSCVLAIRDGVVPPNANYHEPDPECDVHVVGSADRSRPVRTVLNNAFGFGGNISCVVFGAA